MKEIAWGICAVVVFLMIVVILAGVMFPTVYYWQKRYECWLMPHSYHCAIVYGTKE